MPPCPCSIWTDDTIPPQTAVGENLAVELGVKFRSDLDGNITGIRFYKGIGNDGPHWGHLWSNDGSLLARALFTNETQQGWQQVHFPVPVPIQAGVTYIASYHTPSGHYARKIPGFNTGIDNWPLRALEDGEDGKNGVYKYTTLPGAFPSNSYLASNYWVDILFDIKPQTRAIDGSLADFSTGTDNTCYAANSSIDGGESGELALSPLMGEEFSDDLLPAGWSSTPWQSGGTSIVTDGALLINGELAGTDNYHDPGRSLEFEATFKPDPFQDIGYGQTLGSENESWALFSTYDGSGVLYARTNNSGIQTNKPLNGNWLDAPHRYRIDWHADSVVYYIDGQIVHSESATINGVMRPVVSDSDVYIADLKVDWISHEPIFGQL